MNDHWVRPISIVIPVWNEAHYLPRLLEQLRHYLPAGEIVVSDNDSEDQSPSIARQYRCSLVQGGRPGKSRNAGAAVSTGEIILFLDADVLICATDIQKITAHFRDNRVVCVHPRLIPISDNVFIFLCYAIADLYFQFTQKIRMPQGLGSAIAVRRSAFHRVGGFDENLTVGEDVDFFRRIRCFGRIVYDRDIGTFVSARRFLVENKLAFAFKCFVWAILRFFGSSRCPWGYRWMIYPDQIIKQEAAYLSKVHPLR
jgi:glycosyltransferase involved in cell wall biosynthesis